jgi:hypothetical protein
VHKERRSIKLKLVNRAGKAEQTSNVADGDARCDVCVCGKALKPQAEGWYPDLNDQHLRREEKRNVMENNQ